MCGYKIEDLIGKYAKFGGPEFHALAAACSLLGVEPLIGPTMYRDYIEVLDRGNGPMIYGCSEFHQLEDGSIPFTPKPQWSPETNTLPLKDLSDEQAAKLFNAWRGGHVIQQFIAGRRVDVSNPIWKIEIAYRIKTKSEFELFEDKAVMIFGLDTPTEALKKAFDEGFRFIDIKAPEVE